MMSQGGEGTWGSTRVGQEGGEEIMGKSLYCGFCGF